MGRIRKTIVISCIALVLSGGVAVPASADHADLHVYRLGGTDNIGLSVEVSKFHDPEAAFNNHDAFLARSDVYADALTASAGIAIREAPLFLTSPDSLDPRVAAELDRRGTSHIWILGGDQAISPAVEADLQGRGITTERLAGATRVETALAIAESFGADRHNAIVVRGWADGPGNDPTRGFADSLAAGMITATLWSEPIFLSESGKLSDPTAEYISENQFVDGIVVGGPGALSDQVVTDLDARVGGVRRLAGADRYETAVALSTEVTHDYDIGRVVLVDGTRADSWAPGFTASILGTRFSTALVLSNGETLPEASRRFLETYGNPPGVDIELVCTAYTAPAACDAAESVMRG